MKPWPDIDARGDGPREPWLDRGEASPPPSDPFSTPFEGQPDETPVTFLRPRRRGPRLILVLLLCAASGAFGYLYHEYLTGSSTTARPPLGPIPNRTAAGSPMGGGTGAASSPAIHTREEAGPVGDRVASLDEQRPGAAPGPGQATAPAPTPSRTDGAAGSPPDEETPEPSAAGSGGRNPTEEAAPPTPSRTDGAAGSPPDALVHRLARTVVAFSLEQSTPTVMAAAEAEGVSVSSVPLPARVLEIVAAGQRAALAADRLAAGEVDEAVSLVEEAAQRLGEARPNPWPLADRVAAAAALVDEIERALRADRCDTARRALSRLLELARVPEDRYDRSLRACDRRASRPPLTLE